MKRQIRDSGRNVPYIDYSSSSLLTYSGTTSCVPYHSTVVPRTPIVLEELSDDTGRNMPTSQERRYEEEPKSR